MFYKLWCKILGQTCRWENIETINVWGFDSRDMPKSKIVLQKCTTCGEIKKFKIKS